MPKHGSINLYVHGSQKVSLGRTAQDGHLDSHTAPELCGALVTQLLKFICTHQCGMVAAIYTVSCGLAAGYTAFDADAGSSVEP